eukprot:TRINITY_DN114394_c0_g1_i1.p1 TRINITY_DN114394_c0_g1~~TRINITY_DN114394_c0_g1_i1.p1  ORF type:complete len:338 (+),score=39.77 TRINITY_DN114394_c0_g1_i1:75-1088(+)
MSEGFSPIVTENVQSAPDSARAGMTRRQLFQQRKEDHIAAHQKQFGPDCGVDNRNRVRERLQMLQHWAPTHSKYTTPENLQTAPLPNRETYQSPLVKRQQQELPENPARRTDIYSDPKFAAIPLKMYPNPKCWTSEVSALDSYEVPMYSSFAPDKVFRPPEIEATKRKVASKIAAGIPIGGSGTTQSPLRGERRKKEHTQQTVNPTAVQRPPTMVVTMDSSDQWAQRVDKKKLRQKAAGHKRPKKVSSAMHQVELSIASSKLPESAREFLHLEQPTTTMSMESSNANTVGTASTTATLAKELLSSSGGRKHRHRPKTASAAMRKQREMAAARALSAV